MLIIAAGDFCLCAHAAILVRRVNVLHALGRQDMPCGRNIPGRHRPASHFEPRSGSSPGQCLFALCLCSKMVVSLMPLLACTPIHWISGCPSSTRSPLSKASAVHVWSLRCSKNHSGSSSTPCPTLSKSRIQNAPVGFPNALQDAWVQT